MIVFLVFVFFVWLVPAYFTWRMAFIGEMTDDGFDIMMVVFATAFSYFGWLIMGMGTMEPAGSMYRKAFFLPPRRDNGPSGFKILFLKFLGLGSDRG